MANKTITCFDAQVYNERNVNVSMYIEKNTTREDFIKHSNEFLKQLPGECHLGEIREYTEEIYDGERNE